MKNPIAAMALIIILMTAVPVRSQAPCKVGVQAPKVGFWTWAPGSTIKVFVLARDFQDSELPFLLAAVKAWDAVSVSAGSNVRLEYIGPTANPLDCENCLTIRREPVFDKSRRHLTRLGAYSAARNRIITSAKIIIDPLLTNPRALTNAVAHELGHSFGLLDCYSCNERSTVMVQFKDVNVPNGMEGPSRCDLTQVKAIYESLPVELRANRPRTILDDEGEEPVEDDTPIIVRKPYLSANRSKTELQ